MRDSMLSDQMLKFLKENKQYIKENNYDNQNGLYNMAWEQGINTGELTKVLEKAGIDPLEYLDYIPWHFFEDCEKDIIKLPAHIKTIGTGAFHNAKTTKLYIPKDLTHFGSECFKFCNINTIVYPGTSEEFFRINDSGASAHAITIRCTDKEFSFWGEW